MTLEPGSVFLGVIIGAAAAAVLEYFFVVRPRNRRCVDRMPLPDTLIYRNAQSVADWHRRRLEAGHTEKD